jgi:hypothetical protein
MIDDQLTGRHVTIGPVGRASAALAVRRGLEHPTNANPATARMSGAVTPPELGTVLAISPQRREGSSSYSAWH